MKSFRIFSRMKRIICMSVRLNILCLIWINQKYPQNCIQFDNDARVLFNFHSKYSKTHKTHASLSNSMQFWGYWRFMQIRQRIFNCTDMQIMHFILDKILKLLTHYTPFYHQSLQSYLISKTVRFFWPIPVCFASFPSQLFKSK